MPENETTKKTVKEASSDKPAEANSLTRAGFGVGGGGFGGDGSYAPTKEEIAEWDRIAREREEANR